MTYDFELDYPEDLMTGHGAAVIKYPVWGGNVNGYSWRNGRMVEVRALVLHTPEEDADDIESTPYYFAKEGVRRSTHDYLDNDGDLYQMVGARDAAWGQGTHSGNRTWKGVKLGWAPWNPEHYSNNQLSKGLEIEGRAATIHQTLGRNQFRGVAMWIAYNAAKYGIPLDRDHIVGHYELSTDKTDPGKLPIESLIGGAINLLRAGLVSGYEEYTYIGVRGIPIIPSGVPTPAPVEVEEVDSKPALRAAYRRGRSNALRAMRSRVEVALAKAESDITSAHTDAVLDEGLVDLMP
jgi:hypothetical protein